METKELGVKGYYVPKTVSYLNKAFSFTKSKKNEVIKRAKSPDPTAYNDEYKEAFKKFWGKSVRFLKAGKLTIIDDCIKHSKLTPGPGQYFQDSDTKLGKKKNLNTFGYVLNSLSERTGFVEEAQYLSESSPSSWSYKPKEVRPKSAGMSWIKPKKVKNKKKDEVGPGKYADGIERAQVLTRQISPIHTFSKSKNASPNEKRIKQSKEGPPVGSYKNLARVYQKINFKRERTPIIFPYKYKGFADDEIKRAKLTPGPGAYNIRPG